MNSNKTEMRGHPKLGPAGIKCRCCNPWYNRPKYGKPETHRIARHRAKIAVRVDETIDHE